MKFLSMVRVNEQSGQKPSQKLMEDMGKLIGEAMQEGWLVSTAGLQPTSKGFRMRSRYGKLSTVNGPFTETKEVVGGYAILEAPDLAKARELTERFLRVHGEEWDVECEVRPLEGDEFCTDRK